MRWPHQATRTWKVLVVVAIIIKPFFLRLRIEGAEHIPASGGCIAACNHTLGPDYVIMGYASPRQVYYMAKSELFNVHPWLTALLRGAGAFPVRRGERDGDAIEQAVKMIEAGFVVGMFPEGTRSRTGALQRGRTGVARIALQANALVVPVVVINSEPVLRDVRKLRRRPQVTIRFGTPIRPAADLVGENAPADAVHQFTTQIMLALAELLPPARRGYYSAPAADYGADSGEPLLPADSA
jgi:1-acyl-sn-glycerol-3-phosphate acyltransferase